MNGISYGVQCAAVRIHCGAIITPPHICLYDLPQRENLIRCKDTCQGFSSIVVSKPPTILLSDPLRSILISLASSNEFDSRKWNSMKWFSILRTQIFKIEQRFCNIFYLNKIPARKYSQLERISKLSSFFS